MIAKKAADEWHQQWSLFRDNERFLFDEWIAPVRLEDFRGLDVLECGCGGGQHTALLASVARSVTAVDLNTTDLARERNADATNVTFVEADLLTMSLGRQYDAVVCIGVIHHTSDPDQAFANMYRHCRPGGKVVIWTYSAEGNALVRFIVEPLRKAFLARMPRRLLAMLSNVITALLYVPVCSVYLLPIARRLPYYEYFANFRRLSFPRNVLNVFDKLNAPQTRFTTRRTCEQWFNPVRFEPGSIVIRPYVGVSWSLSGVKRHDAGGD